MGSRSVVPFSFIIYIQYMAMVFSSFLWMYEISFGETGWWADEDIAYVGLVSMEISEWFDIRT